MSQFAVYRNKNAQTRARFPFLLDIQSELLDPLATRVVVPLAPASSPRARSMETLMPTISVEGKAYVMVTPQLAGVSARELGPVAADASADRLKIVAAVDFLLAGV
jgi:toxin CcdB